MDNLLEVGFEHVGIRLSALVGDLDLLRDGELRLLHENWIFKNAKDNTINPYVIIYK